MIKRLIFYLIFLLDSSVTFGVARRVFWVLIVLSFFCIELFFSRFGSMIEYIPILVLLCFAILIAVFIVGASYLLGHRISRKAKLSTYECGMQTIGPTRMKMNIRYYIIAMLFLIFDIEIMFLYPWALVTGGLKMFGFVEMLIFIAVLLVGYLYVWKKGALEWE